MASTVIWVIDTSSIISVRRLIENPKKGAVFAAMGTLVSQSRLVFPKQVLAELERAVDRNAPDAQYTWAKQNEAGATHNMPSLEEVKAVLAIVPDVLDPDKDTEPEEADPYVLALALHLKRKDEDVRIVTEELKDTPRKMSLNTAAGLLGIASVPLLAFLRFEKIP